MIIVKNNGPYILLTNYWKTPHARRGLYYVSINARAFRLLVPPPKEAEIGEMRTGQYVIVTRGRWLGDDGLELLFEDGSNSPFAIHIQAAQTDRLPPADESGRTDLRCLVYTEAGLALELPARYRATQQLPCLRPWNE